MCAQRFKESKHDQRRGEAPCPQQPLPRSCPGQQQWRGRACAAQEAPVADRRLRGADLWSQWPQDVTRWHNPHYIWMTELNGLSKEVGRDAWGWNVLGKNKEEEQESHPSGRKTLGQQITGGRGVLCIGIGIVTWSECTSSFYKIFETKPLLRLASQNKTRESHIKEDYIIYFISFKPEQLNCISVVKAFGFGIPET